MDQKYVKWGTRDPKLGEMLVIKEFSLWTSLKTFVNYLKT